MKTEVGKAGEAILQALKAAHEAKVILQGVQAKPNYLLEEEAASWLVVLRDLRDTVAWLRAEAASQIPELSRGEK
jgi:hypothetical protein